ncbi:unnamed protein product [Didymodactylos carnosus]|uniref:guanylate cyclase n=1 Tax=Didymodactylos carnosus TaxID=1234261 RepID=A0A8S2MZV0_9BILA|nr:unnamed protein product [Didymodactylos carnosus]CAF3978862.1 unnamed protein product [Didymodactylos carnosus]
MFNDFYIYRKDLSLIKWKKSDASEAENKKIRRAFETVLIIGFKEADTDKYQRFSNQVFSSFEQTTATINHSSPSSSNKLVNPYVATFYDAVLLYAYGLNQTIAVHGNTNDGFHVVKNMWNSSFEGSNGIVQISETGDRVSDYSLFDLNPKTDEFWEVGTYSGVNSTFVRLREIYWIDKVTKTPNDIPFCGFDGSRCIQPKNPFLSWIYFTVVVSLIVLVLTLLAIWYYKRVSFEAQLKVMNWIIQSEDIFTMEEFSSKFKQVKKDKNKGTSILHFPIFEDTLIDTTSTINSIGTGRYKIKDMQNEHLVRFIGACLDPPCLITEYCSKGSLQDLLESNQIKLDDMFKYSIMYDVVKGIVYIHNSDIHSHGNLKSSNCLIGSRFVVKISDYGIPSLRCSRHQKYPANCEQYYRSLLWSAPEILKDQHAPHEGTQKGDVYSFAIILHEIVYRRGLFAMNETLVEPKEIFQSIKSGDEIRPPFLGENTLFEIGALMKKCWCENPADRPDFSAISSTIRKLSKKFDNENLVDNLLKRMKQYTNNLEELVTERTNDYLIEKKKAEELLYRLLPRSVTAELMAGKSVTAESFSSVTIYFSDICGFTQISSESTPMQVETIGDAYMCVSGLPTPNGNLHAREIARMALAILDAVINFKIRHRPGEQLRIRIGIHSALRIHLSPTTKALLDTFQTFIVKLRGSVTLKGKGNMSTWWLLGEENGLQIPLTNFDNDNDLLISATPPSSNLLEINQIQI